jgi:hypothetical protein
LEVSTPSFSRGDEDCTRVTSEINGVNVFIESNTPLAAHVEAFASAFLLPAMSTGSNLKIEGVVCDVWAKNMQFVKSCTKEWWGFPGGKIIAESTNNSTLKRGTGMFFTAGLDSFYTLLNSPESIDAIVYVDGFDVQLHDVSRLDSVHFLLERIAEEMNVELIRVRTNLRSHPTFNRVGWGRTHGSALAAIGHCLTNKFSKMYMASTDIVGPHGSHPILDPAWSSRLISFANHGSEVTRLEKVRRIAAQPLVLRYLRVCWENNSEDLNCGYCEKCVRTQLQFAAVSAKASSELKSFPEGSLPKRVDRLISIPTHLVKQWVDIAPNLESRRLQRSVRNLIQNRGPKRFFYRLIRFIYRRLSSLLRPFSN